MKKLSILLIAMVAFSVFSFGQFRFGAGAQLIFDGSVFGLQGKALYDLNDDLRLGGAFTFHLEDGINWTLDADAQYKLVVVGDNINIAPLAGLSITDFDVIGTEIGINLGAMLDMPLTDSLDLYVEPKIVIEGFESFTISAGVLF